ncbi:MBL fold metallo-hydrolase [Pedobacter heparinus]|nr:MBL fold metallo-hydrolase [Pedobacter heparinus]
MKISRIAGLVLLMLFWGLMGFSQSVPKNYFGNIPGMLEEQTDSLSAVIQQVLKKYPPSINKASSERRLALYEIDGILHDTRLDSTNALRSFIKDRYELALTALRKPAPKKGIQIIKLYNHGFVIRTATVTIGFDLVLRNIRALAKIPEGVLVNAMQMKEIADHCDVLFVSHQHPDHADLRVARLFAAQQKVVYTPPGLWEGESSYIKVLRDTTLLRTKLKLKNGRMLAANVYPGHQGEILNNLYAVTMPEGYTIMHTGDQHAKRDLPWLRKVHELQKIDVLLVNSFIDNFQQTVDESIRPRLVISSHQNELGHTIDHRGPYWLHFRLIKKFKTPTLMMTWGEHYLYP